MIDALLSKLVDAHPQAQLLVDAAGMLHYANRAAAALLGRDAPSLAGQRLDALVASSAAQCAAIVRQGARSSQATPARLSLRGDGGAVVDCRCEIASVRAAEDAPTMLWLRLTPVQEASRRFVALNERIGALTREIELRRVAEAELYEQREWLKIVLRSIGDGVIITDDQTRVLFFNAVAESLTGWSSEQALGRPLEERFCIVNADSRAPVANPVHAVLRDSRIVTLANPTLLIARDGSEHPIDDAAAPVVDDAGRLHGTVLVFRDITERVQAERQRQALEQQLRAAQKMEAIGTLAGGIAHDFNNVLGAVIANAALAQHELSADHPASEPLRQIGKAGDRARALVRQILAFSRGQPQQLQRQPLRPLVEEAMVFLRGMLPSSAQLDAKLADEPIVALVDGTQIEQVLINLCTNAWHSLQGSSGRIVVELDVVGRQDSGDVLPPHPSATRFARLRVTDDGCGMDELTRERIFEPFFTTKPRGQGTGLGLAVAHGIVAEHRGSMSVRSVPGQGSSFSVLLPLADDDAAPPATRVAPQAAAPARGDGLHVVYVDDDEVMVVTVQALLRRAGYRVSGFGSGAAALAAVSAEPDAYDAVVTDFNMPQMSGIDLAAALQRVRPTLPVIISSGYLSDELRAGATRLGVARLLNKEETLERLGLLLDEVLDARRRVPSTPGRR